MRTKLARNSIQISDDVADTFGRSLAQARRRRGHLARVRRNPTLVSVAGVVVLTGVVIFLLQRGIFGRDGLREYSKGRVAA